MSRHVNSSPLHRGLFYLLATGALAACSSGSGNPVEDAVAAIEQQDYRTARIHLLTALRENSSDPKANLLFARTMIELGDGLSAQTALRKLQGNADYAEQVRPLMARAYLIQDDNEQALELTSDPSGQFAPQLHALRAVALFGLGRNDEARGVLDEALDRYPNEAELRWVKGNYALQVGDLDGAAAEAGKALEQAPGSMEAMMLAGRLALAKGNGKQALAHFTKVRELRPDNITAEYLRGAIYKNMGDRQKARNCFNTVLSASPNHLWAVYFSAQMDFEDGKSDQAFDRLQEFTGDLAEVPPALRLAGILEMRRGNYEQAIDKLNRYVAQNQPDATALMALSRALAGAGNEDDAYRAIAPLAQSITAPVDALEQAADLASDAGSATAADYRGRAAALKGDPDTNAIFEAEQAIIGQEWRQAVVIYDRLLQQDHPQKVMLLNNAAMVQFNLSNGDEAIKLARQARALAPQDPMVADTLGWILLQTRADKVEALALIHEADEAAPGNPEFQWHLANALAANGESAAAREIIERLQPNAEGEQLAQLENLLAWI